MPVTEYRYSVLKSYEKYQHYRTLIYIYTFLSYGILHLNRKSYTNMKMKLQSDAAFDPTFLSVMDTTFMLFYAIGSFFSGTLGDLLSAPLIVSAGLIGASLCMFFFAILVSLDVERSGNELLRTFTPLVSK
jgi:sugar phosphate permease